MKRKGKRQMNVRETMKTLTKEKKKKEEEEDISLYNK